jgi:hypothetical protein
MTQATSQRRHWLTRTLVPLALLIASTNAKCISLATSKACPGFANLQVDTSVVAKLNEMRLGFNLTAFDNIDQFDQAVRDSTAFYTSPDSCSGYNRTENIRYQNTVACAMMTRDSASAACSSAGALTMCRTTCDDYVASLAQMVAKTCPSDGGSTDNIRTFQGICTGTKGFQDLANADTATCISGLKNEGTTCGKFSRLTSIVLFLLLLLLLFICVQRSIFTPKMGCCRGEITRNNIKKKAKEPPQFAPTSLREPPSVSSEK